MKYVQKPMINAKSMLSIKRNSNLLKQNDLTNNTMISNYFGDEITRINFRESHL
jgi:hypothetical protein